MISKSSKINCSRFYALAKIDRLGKITYMSQNFIEKFELNDDYTLDINIVDLMYEGDVKTFNHILLKSILNPQMSFSLDTRNNDFYISGKWTRWELVLKFDKDLDKIEILCLAHDITCIRNEKMVVLNYIKDLENKRLILDSNDFKVFSVLSSLDISSNHNLSRESKILLKNIILPRANTQNLFNNICNNNQNNSLGKNN